MTRPGAIARQAKASVKSSKAAETAPQDWPAPLTPRKGLFVALLVVFTAWVGFLLWMYFTTLPAHRTPAPSTVRAVAQAVPAHRGDSWRP